jgi:hypothetical protein
MTPRSHLLLLLIVVAILCHRCSATLKYDPNLVVVRTEATDGAYAPLYYEHNKPAYIAAGHYDYLKDGWVKKSLHHHVNRFCRINIVFNKFILTNMY